MDMKSLLLAAALLAAPAVAQTQETAPGPATPAPPPQPAPNPALPHVILTTSEGPILVELEKDKAPITSANFLKYVDQKRLDGTTIYRVVKSAPGFGFIQGGVNNDPKRVLPPIAHEPTTKTGLTHVDGALSMPRLAPGTARGEFFITVSAIPSMDADPKLPGDNQGYAVFGHVISGMDIVRHMLDEPTSPTKGEGAMRGQMLMAPVKILTARRSN
jgi:peptidyl-prolyl cis-trans isomerase A (cyclophilin A)